MKTIRTDLTTGDIARHCQTTHFTVGLWIKTGKLHAYKTPGGHHRVRPDDFLSFLSRYGLPIPQALCTPTGSRILVVDDDHTILDMLTRTLRRVGYQVESASDGYDAGLLMATFKPRLLVVDLILPRVNGFDLCTRVKRDAATRDVRIIAMTACAAADTAAKALAAGADLYLEKPFHIGQFVHDVGVLMRGDVPTASRHASPQSVERRETHRTNLTLPIHYSLHVRRGNTSERLTGKGKTINLGRGGLMLETILPLPPTTRLRLQLYLDRRSRPLRLQGEVRWVKRQTGTVRRVGVQFTALTDDDRDHLLDTILQ